VTEFSEDRLEKMYLFIWLKHRAGYHGLATFGDRGRRWVPNGERTTAEETASRPPVLPFRKHPREDPHGNDAPIRPFPPGYGCGKMRIEVRSAGAAASLLGIKGRTDRSAASVSEVNIERRGNRMGSVSRGV
jgi:hypothetical protein